MYTVNTRSYLLCGAELSKGATWSNALTTVRDATGTLPKEIEAKLRDCGAKRARSMSIGATKPNFYNVVQVIACFPPEFTHASPAHIEDTEPYMQAAWRQGRGAWNAARKQIEHTINERVNTPELWDHDVDIVLGLKLPPPALRDKLIAAYPPFFYNVRKPVP